MMTINKLGDDLLIEILIRSFPNPESACRRKLVCKRWSSLILSDPTFNRRFVSRHRSREISEPPPPLLVTPPPPSTTSFHHHRQYLSFLPVPDELWPHFAVLDTSNDLLLCGFLSAGDMVFNRELMRSYLVCNPFTKQWVALPLVPEYELSEVKEVVARLACEPVNPTSLDLGGRGSPSHQGGGGGGALVYSLEYRFCVVLMCEERRWSGGGGDVTLYVFCSESGVSTWDDPPGKYIKTPMFERVVSCNGKLFGTYRGSHLGDDEGGLDSLVLVAMNPFRLDVRPLFIYDSIAFSKDGRCRISVSRGVLHMVKFEVEDGPEISDDGCWRINALISVWRLKEEGGKSWRKLHHVVLVNKKISSSSSGCIRYKLKRCLGVDLHPQKPEIVFLSYLGVAATTGDKRAVVLSYDMTGTGELEFFGVHHPNWTAFQPTISCWPTPIPKYEKLRDTYDDCYNYLLRVGKNTHRS